MKLWRLIAHHEHPEDAVDLYQHEGFIALGWGGIGDLGQFADSDAVAEAIRATYPQLHNTGEGGRCLWALRHQVASGDLIILRGESKRELVLEVAGDYYWLANEDPVIGNYQHRRPTVMTTHDPEELWAGTSVPKGWSVRWAFVPLERA